MASVPVTLVGNVASAPEVQTTAGGKAFVRFRVATNERYRDQGGEWRDHEAVFWDVEAWEAVAQSIGEHLNVGDPVIVTGPMRSQSWETEQREKRVRRFVKCEAIGRDLVRGARKAARAAAAETAAPAVPAPDGDDWSTES